MLLLNQTKARRCRRDADPLTMRRALTVEGVVSCKLTTTLEDEQERDDEGRA